MKPQAPGDGNDREESPAVTREIAAEAAVWVARLHGPNRSPAMERECLEWQSRSAMHRHAFEKCTDTWEDVAHISMADAFRSAAARSASPDLESRRGWSVAGRRMGLAVAALAPIALAVLLYWRHEAGLYDTEVGELQSVVLDDGTRMSLNTSSRARVDLGSSRRLVNVEQGEALFEVAKDAKRPFVVRVGGSEVLAVGTVFAVKLQGASRVKDSLEVTLIEGQVTVRSAGGSEGNLAPAAPMSLHPGDRLRLARSPGHADGLADSRMDRPRLDGVVAWKRNEAIFDDVSLADAVAELNRYNRTPIVLVGDQSLAKLHVSGAYRTGDTAGFARTVAALHGLVVHERDGRMELTLPQ